MNKLITFTLAIIFLSGIVVAGLSTSISFNDIVMSRAVTDKMTALNIDKLNGDVNPNCFDNKKTECIITFNAPNGIPYHTILQKKNYKTETELKIAIANKLSHLQEIGMNRTNVVLKRATNVTKGIEISSTGRVSVIVQNTTTSRTFGGLT